MIFYYINGTDRTGDVESNSLKIQNQIQQRTDNCGFRVFSGTAPSENQDLKVYAGATVSSHAGTSVVLKESYQVDTNFFRENQTIFLQINNALEKATVSAYNESTRTITLSASPTVSMSEDDQIGELIFGGTISKVADNNIGILENIEYDITAIDYSKIFDKKLISDTWADVDSRYIINSFVDSSVNYNQLVDNLDYDNTTALRAEWIESGDGNNPTIDSSDYIIGDTSAVFDWTNSGGTATFSATPTSADFSDFTGVSSGAPTAGLLMAWVKTSNQANISAFKIRIGSDSSNYAEVSYSLTTSDDWQYISGKLVDASITGTPDWTAVDYCAVVITETGDGQVMMNDIRVNADGSFTLYNVQLTGNFDDFRSPQLKPTALMNLLAKTWEYVWYIDYERDIHFITQEDEPSPIEFSDDSDNFTDLKISVDTSNIGNRVVVRGGEKTSASTYSQVLEGTGGIREWLLKSKFKNLTIAIDDNSSTDLMEAMTTTTNVVATGHGLVTGDYIVNRSQNNEVREITKVDDDNFTVEAISGQTSGNMFSKFATSKTAGIEGIDDEALFDYVYNSNEKSVRATASEATLDAGDFILFTYNERLSIQVQYSDSASVNDLKALGLGDGIFDLDPITDRNIQDTTTALSLAQAKVKEFSNAIINGSLVTDQLGLRSGQILHIEDSTSRSLNDDYVIQKVVMRQNEGRFKDYMRCEITFGTTLFGWIEFMQKLLRTKSGLEINVDEIVETYASSSEEVQVSESNTIQTSGISSVNSAETVETSESNVVSDFTPPWKWEANGVGQPLNTRWDLFEWS